MKAVASACAGRWRLLVVMATVCHVAEMKPASVYTTYREHISLSDAEPLTIEVRHSVSPADINWCFWKYRPDNNTAWGQMLGYDNGHRQAINISDRAQVFRFLDCPEPCRGGIWGPTAAGAEQLVGRYQFVIVAQDGAQYESPEVLVAMETEDKTSVMVPSAPPCEDKTEAPVLVPPATTCETCSCSGLIVTVVFLLLLIIAATVLLVLYFMGKLPADCLTELKIPPYQSRNEDSGQEKQEAENERLLQQRESNLKEAVTKLEAFIELKDKELENYEREKDETRRQMNQIRLESAVLKDKTEAQALELTTLQEENDRLRTDFENQSLVMEDFKNKLETDRKPTTKDKVLNATKLVRNKMTSSFRGARDSRPMSKTGQASSSDVRVSDISQAFAVGLKDITMKKDDELKLKIKLCDNFDTKWYRYGLSLDKLDGVTITPGKDHEVKVKVKKRTPDVSGVYTCTAVNDSVSTKTEALVRVVDGDKESPVFMEWLEDMYVKADESVEFSVLLTGNPTPTPIWLHKGKSIDGKAHIKTQTIDKTSGRLTSILTFDPCTSRDSGEVKVTATNMLGSTWCTGQLAVQDTRTPPDFARGLQKKKAQIGEDVTFVVIVTGNPDPTIEWSNGGKPILESDRITIANTYDGRWKSILTIRKCTFEDGGLIIVNAFNDVSKTFCDAHFTVTE